MVRKNEIVVSPSIYYYGAFKAATAATTTKTKAKTSLGKWWLFCDYYFFLAFLLLTEHAARTGRSADEVHITNERCAVVFSRCRLNLNFGIFTSSFGRLRQRIVLKYVPHVQHDYWSSFNQSNHWFMAFISHCNCRRTCSSNNSLQLHLPLESEDNFPAFESNGKVGRLSMRGKLI